MAPRMAWPLAADGTLYTQGGSGILRLSASGSVTELRVSPSTPISGLALDQVGRLYGALPLANRVGTMHLDLSISAIPPIPAPPNQALMEQGCTNGGAGQARFFFPSDVALSPDGQHIYVADTFNDLIRVIDLGLDQGG